MPARRQGSASGYCSSLITSAKPGSSVAARALSAGLASVVAVLWLAGVAGAFPGDEPLKLPDAQLEPVKWSDLDGWAADDHSAAFAAYQTSCRSFRKVKRPRDERPIFHALWEICRRSAALRDQKSVV